MTHGPSGPQHPAELEDLRTRLADAEEALRAIRGGNVDAVLLTGERGAQVYTLSGADRAYRQLIETMSEGAATLSADGVILYCNSRLAKMLERPLDQVIGSALRSYLPPANQQALIETLGRARTETIRTEVNLTTSAGGLVPVYLSASNLHSEGAEVVFGLVLTDLTDQRSHEQVVAAERLARSILEQAAEAIIVCDQQGRVIRASQAGRWLCDCDPLLRPFGDVFALRKVASGPFLLAPVLLGETRRDVDVVLDRQGQPIDLILNAGPLTSGRKILGCVVTLTDITERKRAEAMLRESELRLQSILDGTLDGIVLADAETKLLGAGNAAILRMLGYTAEELSRLSVLDLHPQQDLPQVLEQFTRQSRGESQVAADIPVKRKDGSVFYADITSAPVTFGGKTYLVGMFRDITERKQAEEARMHREAELRESQRIARIGSWEWTPATGVVTWSDGLNHLLARDPGLPTPTFDVISQFYTPESWQRLGVAIARALATGASYDLEVEMIRADGTICWTTTRGEAIPGADGTVVTLRGTVLDIDERKRAESALRLQSAALNAAANAIVITGLDSTIVWANPAFTTLTGYTPAEAIGRTPKELVNSGVHDQAFYKHLWDTILAGGVWFGEVTNRRKDGSQYTEEMTITPVKDDHGAITHFVALKRDLTSERTLQAEFRQAQKMEAVGRLAGGVAHDFNNLLTVILTSCSFIEEELRDEDPMRADIRTIREASQSAATLTRQLLAFSRRQVLQPQTLDLNALVGGMEKMLGRLLGEDILIRFQAASDLGLVIADPGQLEQVVVNLAVNARDAMTHGGTLAIDTANVEVSEAFAREHGGRSAGRYARLTVADTGCGMDPDTLARAFEPFFTTKEVGKGTGLGLSTVYGVVQQSGGLLGVSSEVGRGTAFSVYLPLEAVGAQAWRPATATAPANTADRGEAILLVEDNEQLRVLAARALRKLGYRVLEAGGLEGARRISETEKVIDLLLADVVMPGGSGHAVSVAVLASHPGLKVLYMSGYTDDAIVNHHVLEPGVALLQKPFTPDSLGAKVREVLDAR